MQLPLAADDYQRTCWIASADSAAVTGLVLAWMRWRGSDESTLETGGAAKKCWKTWSSRRKSWAA